MKREHHDETHESRQNLWLLIVAPTLWAGHFLLSYTTAAVWCAKFGNTNASLGPVRIAIGIYTVLALAGIVWSGWDAWRRHRHRIPGEPRTTAFDTSADRHRFLGFATLLLAGLSFVATVFVGIVVLYFQDCR